MAWRFEKLSPCNDCPYRMDAPLQLWHRAEFAKLRQEDQKQFGAIYGCHKKDGHVCVGWLMKQDERYCPNISLRLFMIKQKISRDYLDKLHCKAPLYSSVDEMIEANYPNENL